MWACCKSTVLYSVHAVHSNTHSEIPTMHCCLSSKGPKVHHNQMAQKLNGSSPWITRPKPHISIPGPPSLFSTSPSGILSSVQTFCSQTIRMGKTEETPSRTGNRCVWFLLKGSNPTYHISLDVLWWNNCTLKPYRHFHNFLPGLKNHLFKTKCKNDSF